MILVEFHDYIDIFYEQLLRTLLTQRKWDHKIELKVGFEAKKACVILMTPNEKKRF